jgi:predicted RNA-binding Zn-ribbon protein involved in translation (DUF1610 family)
VNIGIALIFVLLAAGYAFWVIRQARVSYCPNCARDDEDAPLWPVLGNLLWWCPNCGELQQSRVLRAAVHQATRDDSMRERLTGAVRRRKPGSSDAPLNDEPLGDPLAERDDEPRRPSF